MSFVFNSADDLREALADLRRDREPEFDSSLLSEASSLDLAREFLQETSRHPENTIRRLLGSRYSPAAESDLLSLLNEGPEHSRKLQFPELDSGTFGPLLESLSRQTSLEEFELISPQVFLDPGKVAALVKCLSALPALKKIGLNLPKTALPMLTRSTLRFLWPKSKDCKNFPFMASQPI